MKYHSNDNSHVQEEPENSNQSEDDTPKIYDMRGNFILSPIFFSELKSKLNDYRDYDEKQINTNNEDDLKTYHVLNRRTSRRIRSHTFTQKSENNYCFPTNKFVRHKFSYDPKLSEIYNDQNQTDEL